MKKTLILAALSTALISTNGQAAENNTLATSQDFQTLKTAPSAPAAAAVQTPPQTQASSTAPKTPAKGLLKGGARIVPDTSPAPAPAPGKALQKSDQGYSNMSAYNVVNDQNKPVTQDWTRPKSWRIGYKNKNRTPINE